MEGFPFTQIRTVMRNNTFAVTHTKSKEPPFFRVQEKQK